MAQGIVIAVWLGLAIVAANLPWLSERWFLVIARRDRRIKPFWLRLMEWAVLYALVLGLGLGLEQKATGHIHAQAWEFLYSDFVFVSVGALPSFVYRYQLRRVLEQSGW